MEVSSRASPDVWAAIGSFIDNSDDPVLKPWRHMVPQIEPAPVSGWPYAQPRAEAPTLETPRLRLRHIRLNPPVPENYHRYLDPPDDADALHAIFGRLDVMKNFVDLVDRLKPVQHNQLPPLATNDTEHWRQHVDKINTILGWMPEKSRRFAETHRDTWATKGLGVGPSTATLVIQPLVTLV